MATSTTSDQRPVSKASKWFASKSLKLSFHGLNRSKSTSSPGSPATMSPRRTRSTPRLMNSSSSATPRTREDELRQVFRHFDGNGDGKISALELRSYFGSVGEYMSHEEAREVINELDADGDDLIDFQDFSRLMMRNKKDKNNSTAGVEEEEEEDLKKAFEMFELEKGCITPKSLQRMLVRLGDTKSYDECAAMIQVFDVDGNGVVDFDEFHQMMTP